MSDSIQVTEITIPLPEGTIFAKKWSSPDHTTTDPIVLLHDSLGCVDTWREFPKALSLRTHRNVIAYDRLGFGRSSARTAMPSKRFITEEAEVYLPLVLKALSIKKFSLLGHSVGGSIAIVAAARMPDTCIKVITESAQAFVEDRTRDGINSAKENFRHPDVFAKLQKYHGANAKWVLDSWTEVWLSKDFANWSLEKDLPNVKCPLLVIHGDKDEFGSKAFPQKISALAGGQSQMKILSNCGHIPHRDAAARVLDLAADFYSGLL